MLPTAPAPPQRGLTTAAAEMIRARVGANVVPERRPPALWRRFYAQLRDPMMVVLLAATGLTLGTGDTADCIIIAVVIATNTVVGVMQEIRADRAIAALARLAAPHATVLRDGRPQVLGADLLVPDDVVLLADGDVVPADGRLTEGAALRVDESSVTGESVPADKSHLGSVEEGALSAGTIVVHGRGVMTVTATGGQSTLGRAATHLGEGRRQTPLQQRLTGLSRVITLSVVLLCLSVLGLGLARGQSTEIMLVTAVSLAVAAIPESLPAVVTLSLAVGARRMSRRNALVRRLPAVETLGSVTLLATDKTGTLTQGRMVVEDVWVAPGGTDVGVGTGVSAVLGAAALCSDAELDGGSGAVGDPTEVALVVAARDAGSSRNALAAEWPRVAEAPFDSERRRMTTVHRDRDGDVLVVLKGAPQAVLDGAVVRAPGALLDDARTVAETYAAGGCRVLAVAARPGRDEDARTPAAADHDLVLLGLVALADPERPEAAATVAACVEAGLTPVLVTGDHPSTAAAIARRVGIADESETVNAAGTVDLDAACASARVFARTSPEQKLTLIRGWQRLGHVVAMTGDGVNDAPALRAADIGVAMGRRGTEVARQAADVVLADDNLDTLVHAVAEGRRVYANIRRFLLYGLAGGTAELVVMLLGPAFGLALPLLPAQILWVNLLTHGLPGVALGFEAADADVLSRGPRPPREPMLGGGLWRGIAGLAVLMAAATLGAALWARHADAPWRSVAFLMLAMSQLGVALGVRARCEVRGSRALLAAVLVAAGLAFAGVYLPGLQSLLDTTALPLHHLAVVAAVAVAAYAVTRVLVRGRHARP